MPKAKNELASRYDTATAKPAYEVHDLPYSEQFGPAAAKRKQEALQELQQTLANISPDQISQAAETARVAFARTAPKPTGKPGPVIREPMSFTMPDGTVITHH